MLRPALPLLLALALMPAPAATRPPAARPVPTAEIAVRGRRFRAKERVQVMITIRNQGQAPMPPVPVALVVDGTTFADWTLPRALPPGESLTWRVTYTGQRGMHLLVATVDPLNEVPQADHSRASAFLNLPLAEARSPLSRWAIVAGFLAFCLGLAAGVLLRRPPTRSRRARPRAPVRPGARPPVGSRR
jgi:hypothetical protein